MPENIESLDGDLEVMLPSQAVKMIEVLVSYGLWGSTVEDVATQLVLDQLKQLMATPEFGLKGEPSGG